MRELLDRHQVGVYFAAVAAAACVAWLLPGATAFESVINPALALMLFATFLQVPLAGSSLVLLRGRFLPALLLANFIAVPLFVAALTPLLPTDPMLRFGVLLVLLTPCIDYVVTFAHLGRADARLILLATPILLVVQLLLLPVYLGLLLGDAAAVLVQPAPFVRAFVWLIAVPVILAALMQRWALRSRQGERAVAALGWLPVPATAFVLFVVVAAVVPQLGTAGGVIAGVVPFYLVFAIAAPLIGWGVSRLFDLQAAAGRAVAFSAATRNSLVVLPLALAVPGAVPILPAVIVTQTLIELVSMLIYIRLIPKLGVGKPL